MNADTMSLGSPQIIGYDSGKATCCGVGSWEHYYWLSDFFPNSKKALSLSSPLSPGRLWRLNSIWEEVSPRKFQKCPFGSLFIHSFNWLLNFNETTSCGRHSGGRGTHKATLFYHQRVYSKSKIEQVTKYIQWDEAQSSCKYRVSELIRESMEGDRGNAW